MIQIFCDEILTYDSRIDDFALTELKIVSSVSKAGTATLTMPPNHPAYDMYIPNRSIVEIYRDKKLKFRGRALYPTDDFYGKRTIICEGERNFLRDGIHRPYSYNDTPANIFTEIIQLYNAQVEDFKQFQLGEVDVEDVNETIELNNEKAENFSTTVENLIKKCGGYISFSTTESGERAINWTKSIGGKSSQPIEFGKNLLDFSRTGINTDFCTVVIPYGKKDENTGKYLDISSVNDGIDFLQDYDAVSSYGTIAVAVYYDDIINADILLQKGQEYLSNHRNIISSLELSAVDLSLIDRAVESYGVGDMIPVKSKPHGIDTEFMLMEKSENMLNPSGDKISLGKETITISRAKE